LARFRTTTILRPLNDLLFITRPVGSHKPSQLLPALSQTVYNEEFSGNLGNAGGFYHRRAALTLRKPGGLILVRVDTAELFSVGIKDTDKIMVMFAATIFAESSLALNSRLTGLDFCHVGHPVEKEYVQHYRREASAAQVPEKIVSRTPLHLDNAYAETESSLRGKRKTWLRISIALCPALKRRAKTAVSR